MARRGVEMRLELDEETNIRLEQMADERAIAWGFRSKRALCRSILRRKAAAWWRKQMEKRGGS